MSKDPGSDHPPAFHPTLVTLLVRINNVSVKIANGGATLEETELNFKKPAMQIAVARPGFQKAVISTKLSYKENNWNSYLEWMRAKRPKNFAAVLLEISLCWNSKEKDRWAQSLPKNAF